MRRDALEVFFQRVLIASLPLGWAACGGDDVAPARDLAAQADAGVDAGASPDLLPDPCETLPQSYPIAMPDAALPPPMFNGNCYFMGPCSTYCAAPYYSLCCTETPDSGVQQLDCIVYCGNAGRRPAGLARARASGGCAVGRYFAEAAHLEAASVRAFRDLARALARNGAPPRLVSAARRAARDELRHARVTARLARAHGGRPAPVEISGAPPRSLEAIAIDNAAEGCVRETFGALVASWQARVAGDAKIRAALAPIARDELRHARLAWDLDAWAQRRLDRPARQKIAGARARAIADLAAEITEPPATLVHIAGVPSAAQSRVFIDAARAELWV